MSDVTVKKYVDYLRQAFLIQLLTKHSFKSKERIRNAKAYIVDSGLQIIVTMRLQQRTLGGAWKMSFTLSFCADAQTHFGHLLLQGESTF